MRDQPQEPPSPLRPEEEEIVLGLRQKGKGLRPIAEAIGRDRKTIRHYLRSKGLLPSPQPAPDHSKKLEHFETLIQEKVLSGLTTSRILREIRQVGYAGGRTILAERVSALRASVAPKPRAKRRFETGPGEEMQVDWSTYNVLIAGVKVVVHALACLLAFSRKLYVRFFRNERQDSLLEGLTGAFEAFGGVTLRIVFDNMATVVLGRFGPARKPLWHPRFLDFARHYGFQPYAARPFHPDRKGKDERVLFFLEQDFIRGSQFDSFDDLNQRGAVWLDEVANARVHGTTRRVPDEAFRQEHPLLIRLPHERFPVYQQSLRQAAVDATISVNGTLYRLPDHLAARTVPVRLYAEHFEALGPSGTVIFSRRYVEPSQKGILQNDSHADPFPQGRPAGSERLEDLLLGRFPTLAELVAGITARMKSLAHVHLRILLRLSSIYAPEALLKAAEHAQRHRRFNAHSVARILERQHPLPQLEPIAPLGAAARAHALLGDVDPGSLDTYAALDTLPPTKKDGDENPG